MKSVTRFYSSLLAVLMLIAFSPAALRAEAVSPEQAKQVASRFMKKHSVQRQAPQRGEMETAVVFDATDRSGNPYLYAVNLPQESGYVLVSGDDRFAEVLGYGDAHAFDEQNMPENMRAWLRGYIQEISYLGSMGYQPSVQRAPAVKASISPLITTEWNQKAPYNDLCPYDTYNSANSVTGCVATALAQLINYHMQHYNAPTAIVAKIDGYTTTRHGLNVPAVSAGTALPDKSLLLNTYGQEATDAQKEAVAKLMLYCGASVHMDYTAAVSSASSVAVSPALINHFGFDNTARIVSRANYRYANWVDMIYKELAASRPVFYSGSSSGGGHAFIVDGYDGNGLFHINWGWGGYCDDYFALSVLNPNDNGQIGASSSSDGYTINQDAVIGIQINSGQSLQPEIYLTTTIKSVDNTNHTVSFSAFNMTGETHSFDCNILGFVEENGTITPIGSYQTYNNIPYCSGYNFTCAVPVNTDYANKTKKVVPISREAGSGTWYAGAATDIQYVSAAYDANGVPTLTIHPIYELQVNSISVPTGKYLNEEQTVKVSVTNNAEEYYGVLYLFASQNATKGTPEAQIGITALEGSTQDVNFGWTPTATGEYNLWVAMDSEGNNVLASSKVTIKEDASLQGKTLIIASLSLDKLDKNSFQVDDNTGIRTTDVYSDYLSGTVTVKNNTSSSISQQVKVLVEPYNEQTGQYENDDYTWYFSFTLPAGKTINLGIDRGPFAKGKTYRVALVRNTQPVEYLDNRYVVRLREGAGPATALDQTSQEPMTKSQKVLKDGQLLIIRDGKIYTVTGQVVR